MYNKVKATAEALKNLHVQAQEADRELKKIAEARIAISDEQRGELLTMTGQPA